MKKETIQALIDWFTANAPKAATGGTMPGTAALIKALQAELSPAPTVTATTPPPIPPPAK